MNRSQPTFHSVCISSGRSESLQMSGAGGKLHDFGERFVPISRCVSTERYYRFTFEVIALRKGVDNHRSCPPPYGTANEYRIILFPIFDFLFDGGAGIGFFFGLCNLGARSVLAAFFPACLLPQEVKAPARRLTTT